MPSKKMVKARNNNKRRKPNARAGTGANEFPSTRGDVPATPRLMFDTSSIRPPSHTDIFTCRLIAPPVLVTAIPSTIVSANLVFTLNSLTLDAGFQSVFDSYRIDCVRVTVKPQNTAIGLVTNATTSLVDFYNVIDYNSSTGATTASAFTKYENCVILPPGEGCSRVFQPRPQTVVSTLSGTGFEATNPMWLNIINDDVPHFGFRYLVPGTTAAQAANQSWEVHTEYWISFKSVN